MPAVTRRRGSLPTVAALAVSAVLVAAVAPARGAQQRFPTERVRFLEAEIGAPGTLRARVEDADVVIGPAAGATAVVEVHLRSNDMEWARQAFEDRGFELAATDAALTVTSGRDAPGVWRRSGDRWMSVRVDVRLPPGLDIDVETGDGDLEIGIVARDVRLVTRDGDVDAGDLEAREVVLDTSDGDLRARSLTAASLDLRTSDGDVDVETATGRLAVDTSDGDIRLGLLIAGSARIETAEGDVWLGIAGGVELHATTHEGDIVVVAPRDLRADLALRGDPVEVDPELGLGGRRRSRVVEGALNGGGPLIDLRADDGSVRLQVRDGS